MPHNAAARRALGEFRDSALRVYISVANEPFSNECFKITNKAKRSLRNAGTVYPAVEMWRGTLP